MSFLTSLVLPRVLFEGNQTVAIEVMTHALFKPTGLILLEASGPLDNVLLTSLLMGMHEALPTVLPLPAALRLGLPKEIGTAYPGQILSLHFVMFPFVADSAIAFAGELRGLTV